MLAQYSIIKRQRAVILAVKRVKIHIGRHMLNRQPLVSCCFGVFSGSVQLLN